MSEEKDNNASSDKNGGDSNAKASAGASRNRSNRARKKNAGRDKVGADNAAGAQPQQASAGSTRQESSKDPEKSRAASEQADKQQPGQGASQTGASDNSGKSAGKAASSAGSNTAASADAASAQSAKASPDAIRSQGSAAASQASSAAATPGTASTRSAEQDAAERGKSAAGASRTGAASASASGQTSGAGANPPGQSARSGGDGRSGGRGPLLVAIIALIVAVVAVIGAGWLWFRGEQRMASLDARVNTVEDSIQSNVQDVVMPRLSKFDKRLQSLSNRIGEQGHTASALQQSIEEARQSAQKTDQALKQSLQALRAQNAKLADKVDGSANRENLGRIESLLRAANRRLQLYDDVDGATHALQLASDAIGRRGDPRLFDVRAEIADEVAALDALPNPDLEGMSLTLSAMIKQVPKLPLASSVPDSYQQQADGARGSPGDTDGGSANHDDSADSGDDGRLARVGRWFSRSWQQFKDSVGNALSGMLTIRRSDGSQPALLPPKQVFFLNQNLQLELRSARLALLKKDTKSFRESLASANQWLGDYYDTHAAAVSKLRARIDKLRQAKLSLELPDVSKSLTMLRQLMADNSGSGGDGDTGKDSASAGSGSQGSSGNSASEGDQ